MIAEPVYKIYSKVKMHIAADQRILCQKPVHVNPVDIGASVWFTVQTEGRSFISQEPLSSNRLYSTKESADTGIICEI